MVRLEIVETFLPTTQNAVFQPRRRK